MTCVVATEPMELRAAGAGRRVKRNKNVSTDKYPVEGDEKSYYHLRLYYHVYGAGSRASAPVSMRLPLGCGSASGEQGKSIFFLVGERGPGM